MRRAASGARRPPAADYGFEYSDEEQEEEDVDIENQYYNSKGTGRHAGAAAATANQAAGCRQSDCASHARRSPLPPLQPPHHQPLSRPRCPNHQACWKGRTPGRPSTDSTRWCRWRAKRGSGEWSGTHQNRGIGCADASTRARRAWPGAEAAAGGGTCAVPPAARGDAGTRMRRQPRQPTQPPTHLYKRRGFKALKQVVKLHYKLNQPDKMMDAYRWAGVQEGGLRRGRLRPAAEAAAASRREPPRAAAGRRPGCCATRAAAPPAGGC